MKTFIKLLLLFFLGGIFGGLLEIGYQIITRGDFVLGGFLYGPFRPIYGCGFLIMYLIGKKVNKNPIMVFLVSFLVCSIFEYSVSYILEVIFNTTWWDYKEFYLNIDGRICIAISIFWGLLGLLFVKLISPIYDKWYEKINKKNIYMFLILISIFFIADTVISSIVHLNAK